VHEPRLKGKSHVIPKRLVWDAWQKVKEKGGADGADGVSIEQLEEDLSGNLYVLWNRMSSGSYFPGRSGRWRYPRRARWMGSLRRERRRLLDGASRWRRCCMDDEGGPLAAALQGETQISGSCVSGCGV
jgi:hypothetical protein